MLKRVPLIAPRPDWNKRLARSAAGGRGSQAWLDRTANAWQLGESASTPSKAAVAVRHRYGAQHQGQCEWLPNSENPVGY